MLDTTGCEAGRYGPDGLSLTGEPRLGGGSGGASPLTTCWPLTLRFPVVLRRFGVKKLMLLLVLIGAAMVADNYTRSDAQSEEGGGRRERGTMRDGEHAPTSIIYSALGS